MKRDHRFSANYIFPLDGPPIKNGVVVLDSNDAVKEVISPGDFVNELPNTEFHNGIIVPGFINSHCHLELSHLRGALKGTTGIAGFVSQVRGLRKSESDDIHRAIKDAIQTLKFHGIVAVGDICNTIDTLDLKKDSDILFHNFIEQFGLASETANEKFAQSKELLKLFQNSLGDSSSITPHSTYSLSYELWNLVKEEVRDKRQPVSIHYGESKQEYLLLKEHAGPLADNFKQLGIPLNLPDCKSPFEVVKEYLPKQSKMLFIHNTFAEKEEIQRLKSNFNEAYFVLCPSSNLFIEGVLPDVEMLAKSGAKIALGTDSYASSNTISIFDQMMILLEAFPSLSFDQLLTWATINGAKALNFDSKVGSIEIGKTPGLNLITNFDFMLMRPTSKSRVKRLA
jgi:cytosine/adenosine deaminase-related metal-dependent hydrolase